MRDYPTLGEHLEWDKEFQSFFQWLLHLHNGVHRQKYQLETLDALYLASSPLAAPLG